MDRFKPLIVFAALLITAPFSFAQALTTWSTLDNIPRIVSNGSGLVVKSALDGVTVGAVGNAAVTAANGFRFTVPVTTTATLSGASMAATAARIARAGSAIGVAWMAWDTYNWIKQSGVTVCPAPDFFCQPGTASPAAVPGDPSGTGYYYQGQGPNNVFSTPKAACDYWMNTWWAGQKSAYAGSPWQPTDSLDANYACTVQLIDPPQSDVQTVYNKMQLNKASNYFPPTSSSPTPFAAPDPTTGHDPLADAIAQASGWPSIPKDQLYNSLRTDQGKAALPDAAVVPPTTPLAVSASPQTSPQFTTQTQTLTNPDGSTSTVTTKETTTVTPTTTGTTVGDSKTTFPTTTTDTTTTTNNQTGVATTNTTTNSAPTQDTNNKPDDICALHPDALGCQKLGTAPDADKVTDKQVALTINPDSGWSQGAGTCPAPRTVQLYGGHTFTFQWDTYCDFATRVKPFIVGMAYLTAILGFLGFAHKNR